MLNWLITVITAIVLATLVTIGVQSLLEALRRRGFDPIGDVAKFLSPTDSRSEADASAIVAGA